jgi:hypothetical protein
MQIQICTFKTHIQQSPQSQNKQTNKPTQAPRIARPPRLAATFCMRQASLEPQSSNESASLKSVCYCDGLLSCLSCSDLHNKKCSLSDSHPLLQMPKLERLFACACVCVRCAREGLQAWQCFCVACNILHCLMLFPKVIVDGPHCGHHKGLRLFQFSVSVLFQTPNYD